MSEATFPQAQQFVTFWEKAAKDHAAAVEAAFDTSLAISKASVAYATQVSEQWTKLTKDALGRFNGTT